MLLAVVVLTAGVAAAQTIEDAVTAHFEGRFLAAADLGEAIDTSEGYALAAQSLTIYGHHLATTKAEQQAVLLRAMDLGERAVELDDTNPFAHQALAHAMGRYAETLPIIQALRDGYAEKTMASMKRGLTIDPDYVYGHLAVGSWHAKIIDAAGLLAAVIYGASEDRALDHYRRAIELAPDNVIVMAGFAIGLLQLDAPGFRDQAEELLARIEAAPKEAAFERLLHREVLEYFAALDGG